MQQMKHLQGTKIFNTKCDSFLTINCIKEGDKCMTLEVNLIQDIIGIVKTNK